MTNEELALQIDSGCDLDEAVPAIEAHDAALAARIYAQCSKACRDLSNDHRNAKTDLFRGVSSGAGECASMIELLATKFGEAPLLLPEQQPGVQAGTLFRTAIHLNNEKDEGVLPDGRVIRQGDVLTLRAGILLINGKGP